MSRKEELLNIKIDRDIQDGNSQQVCSKLSENVIW